MLKSLSLRDAIEAKTAKVGVVGLGYVGVPLIQAFVKAGFGTMGFDIDQTKSRPAAGRRKLHRPHPVELDRRVHPQPNASCRRPTCGGLREADAVLICVPTPLTDSRDPDLSYIEATARQIAAVLRPGPT